MASLALLLQNENSTPTAATGAWLGAFVGVWGLVTLALVIFGLIINWRIASKAGYPGAYSLLMLIPIVNVIVVILFAFSEWPIERELRGRGGIGRS